ncbi:MAG TPA: hypothetical protein VK402_09940 [Blastococcus sp.]|nr:hypothetical protein [Blastococcus sp.]
MDEPSGTSDVKVVQLSDEEARAIRSVLLDNSEVDPRYRILILVDPPGVCIPWN